MTKEKIDTVLERLDSLGLGVDNGDAGSDKDTKVVSELMDYIRDAVGRQTVSGKAQTGSGI